MSSEQESNEKTELHCTAPLKNAIDKNKHTKDSPGCTEIKEESSDNYAGFEDGQRNTIFIKEEPFFDFLSDEQYSDKESDVDYTPSKQRSQGRRRGPKPKEKGSERGKISLCEICGKLIISLEEHLDAHNGVKRVNCEQCGKSFLNLNRLRVHVQTHTEERLFQCGLCNKSFTKRDYLRRHKLTHQTEKTVLCTICNKGFTLKVHLRAHMRKHSGERPYPCEFCDKWFSHSGNLKTHVRNMHYTIKKKISCNVCGREFIKKRNYNVHMANHALGEERFKCKECGKVFKKGGILRDHLRIHSGEKPYSCKICDKAFTQSGSLSNHMKFHKKKSC